MTTYVSTRIYGAHNAQISHIFYKVYHFPLMIVSPQSTAKMILEKGQHPAEVCLCVYTCIAQHYEKVYLFRQNKDIIGKVISRGREWHKNELRSTFQ